MFTVTYLHVQYITALAISVACVVSNVSVLYVSVSNTEIYGVTVCLHDVMCMCFRSRRR